MSETVLPIGAIGVALLMALVTYGWRAAGFVTMGLFEMTPRLKRGLEALPGAIIFSTVLPMIGRTGLGGAVGIAAGVATMLVTRSEFLAVVAGAAAAAAVRVIV